MNLRVRNTISEIPFVKARVQKTGNVIPRMSHVSDLKRNIRTINQLKKYIPMGLHETGQLSRIIERHPMSIPMYYLSLIDPDDPDDPIRKMAVPSVHELNLSGSYDTSGERENTKMAGLQHKYSQTALLLLTNRCAMYCRHCFRKRLVGLENEEILRRFHEALDYISRHREINNVLVTGGDPFVLPTRIIKKVISGLSDIDHLNFIRIGTRIPVTFPSRISGDEELLADLASYSRPDRRIYVVTQFNHPREITPQSILAVNSLLESGVIVNNQAVLLKGVNDDPAVLAELLRNLVKIGVNPYYVFQCRPVKRVKNHFQIPLVRGYNIVEQAKAMIDGHSKRFKFIMSHRTGKIEILGIDDERIYFKYHQAKNPALVGKFFMRRRNPTAGWLDELEPMGRRSSKHL